MTVPLLERLRDNVILGVPPPGAKLKLKKLSKAYDVSVNRLREALSSSAGGEGARTPHARDGRTANVIKHSPTQARIRTLGFVLAAATAGFGGIIYASRLRSMR